jgi:hypothetical protein
MSEDSTGAAAPWFGADVAPEIKGYVENKGWDSPIKAIEGYKHLEQLMGADKAGRGVVWPKDETDADGWNSIYSRLGRPEKPDGYKLPVPEGQSDVFAKTLMPKFHELGFSQKQAEGLAKFWNDYSATEQKQHEAAVAESLRKDQEALKAEWGGAHDQNLELAKRTAKALGFGEEDLADMMAAVGYAKVSKMLVGIGERIGEDKMLTGGQPSARKLSPEAAQQRLNELMLDKGWVDKLLAGDVAAKQEKDRLDMAIIGQAA